MKVKHLRLCDLQSEIELRPNVFIACGSFEDRCRSVAEHIDTGAVRTAIIVENVDHRDYVEQNAKELCRLFGDRAVPVETDTTDPLVTADKLQSALKESRPGGLAQYLVDITTFTHESLLILLRLLALRSEPGDRIKCVYTSAEEYAPGLGNEYKWLSKGVAEARSVLGYAGEMVPAQRVHLVILVGYEHERASSLIDLVEPHVLSLGCGKPGTATSPKHQQANEHFHKFVQRMAAVRGAVESFGFSCCDPWEARDAILKQTESHRSHNTVVAPMNTKISPVGAALAAFSNESIQLCYAQALRYNYESYSVPAETCYLFELPELMSGEKSGGRPLS